MQLKTIQSRIYDFRGQRVMLDFDLAILYGVETKSLNLAVKRNKSRFPPDFMFRLNQQEWKSLRLQIETSNKRGGSRYPPYAFTEQGVAMLSSVLRSPKAIKVNIDIMRVFVFMRQYALSHKDLTEKLKAMEQKYDIQFRDIYHAINFLLTKDKAVTSQRKRRLIGFERNEKKIP
jgi:hypothetical protein